MPCGRTSRPGLQATDLIATLLACSGRRHNQLCRLSHECKLGDQTKDDADKELREERSCGRSQTSLYNETRTHLAQGCAHFSAGSANRCGQVTCHARRTSSPLRPSLGFWYTQWRGTPPTPIAASRPCGATRDEPPASPAATASPLTRPQAPDTGGIPARSHRDRRAEPNSYRPHAPGAGTPRQRSGRSRGSLRSDAWKGRRLTAAAHRGSCAWVISIGPFPLLWKKERGPADSPITQRRSLRPSTALLPWSPWTGTGGRHH